MIDDLFERLESLTGPQKLMGAVGIYVLVALVIFLMLIRPTVNNTEAAIARQAQLEAEEAENRKIAENRALWEESVNRLNEELAKAVKELPNSREIPELLRRISSIGKKIGLEFRLFQPMPEIIREFYAEVPVKLKVQGSFHEVATFFDRVGKLNRIVNVRNITLSDPEERSGKIMMTIEGTAVTYRFLTDDEKAAAGGRGRRR
ncbi:MAG: pilus assembly protein PilO [Deltaproteobacteria bacterium]|nr:pilus assembly protein PilO [Deltaproteobacteria bacterium]